MGNTGHGKSTLGNVLANEVIFKASFNIESETTDINGIIRKFRNLMKGVDCVILDTPGLANSKG